MSYRISVKYTANREVRIASGVAVSRFREEKAVAAEYEPLDISAKVQRSTGGLKESSPAKKDRGLKPGWGTLGRQDRTFNAGTRHALLECGAVVDMWHGKRAIVLTGTLPGSTNEANEVLAAYSAYVVNRLNQYCRRLVDGELWCFYVWEWQKRGALHIHYCLACSDRAALSRVCAGFRDFWFSLLLQLSEKSGVDLFRRASGGSCREQKNKLHADAQFVQKSVAAYFAKYAGKNYHSEVSKHLKSRRLNRYVPSRWAGWSRPVSRAMKSCRWSFEIEGDRRSIERKLNEITGFLSAFCVKKNSWDWNCIPGSTTALYFRTEDLLEVQREIFDMCPSGANFDSNGRKKELERVRSKPATSNAFWDWLRTKKDKRPTYVFSYMFSAYLQGKGTEKGEEELEALAREWMGERRIR